MREYNTVYDVKEASSILNLNEQAIRRLIRNKKLKAIRLGKKYVIPRSELDMLVQGSTGTAFHDKEVAYLNVIHDLKSKNLEYEEKFKIMRGILETLEGFKDVG